METKRCGYAGHVGQQPLDVTQFFKNRSSRDGYANTCRECSKVIQKSARERDLDTARAKGRQSYEQNKQTRLRNQQLKYEANRSIDRFIVRQMLNNAKNRAKKNNMAFDISIEDILIPDVCPVLGIPITRSQGVATDNSPTLDRIDSSKGYIKGNVHVISKRANTIKNCGTPTEHKLIYEYFSSINSGGQIHV